jgi:hypothetical protein
MGGDASTSAGCMDTARMGEHACANRGQYWEPCGGLGKDAPHAVVAKYPKCGVALAPVMGYCCPRSECPTGLGPRTC